MSNFLERILGVKPFEEEIDDYSYSSQDDYDMELREKIFSTHEDLTYDEFIRLIDITRRKFITSFGCYGNDYEIVFRKKSNKPPKKKKESEKVKDEK